MILHLQPITLREANRFVEDHHRHHGPSRGCIFCVAVNDGSRVVGVAIVGRPVARGRQDGYTAEVTRVCVLDGHPNACSKLYAAAWRAARAIGYRRIGTYTMAEETGTSLRAAGWKEIHQTKAQAWGRRSRPRVDLGTNGQKTLWEVAA